MNKSTLVDAYDYLMVSVRDRLTALCRLHLLSRTSLGVREHQICRRLGIPALYSDFRRNAQISDMQLFHPVDGTALRQ